MLENSQISLVHNQIVIVFLGGFTGVTIVFIVFMCVCWLKRTTNRQNEQSDGYQEVHDTERVTRIRHPFRKVKSPISNGTVGAQSNILPTTSSIPRPRCFQLPTTPLPTVPATSTPSASAIGTGRGTLTRESSTSELYATVDRNPSGNDNERRKRSSDSKADGTSEQGEEHTYSKIKPPPGMYDEIDDTDAIIAKRPSASLHPRLTFNSEDDPFYSQVDKVQLERSSVRAPPPIPRLPLKRSSHPYDYPQFVNDNGPDRWQPTGILDAAISQSFRKITDDSQRIGFDAEALIGTNGDALYSKIDSQYGGSEDPYSSIKSSEEHYSSVLPNRADNDSGNSGNNDKESSNPIPTPLVLRGGKVPAYGFIRPRSLRKCYPRRSRSDGEEYSVVTKQFERGPPPVPEKRYSAAPFSNSSRVLESPSTASPVNYDSEPDGVLPSSSRDRQTAHSSQNAASTSSDAGKREPSYRFITVRESLDALRARMEAAAAAAPSSTPISAHSDSSLHYYATISEHSYEVVPSLRSSARNTQTDSQVQSCRAVSYIDDDEDELGTGLAAELVPALNHSPNSSKLDDSDSSSNTILNVSTGSRPLSTSSHVTLVHVAEQHTAPSSSANIPGHSATPIKPDQHKRRQTEKLANSDALLGSLASALTVDIESSSIDENRRLWGHRQRKSPSKRSPVGKSPEIVQLDKLENFDISSSTSLDQEDDARAMANDSVQDRL